VRRLGDTVKQALDGAPMNLVFRCNRGPTRIHELKLLLNSVWDSKIMFVSFKDKLSV
jgi:hypothetical protein